MINKGYETDIRASGADETRYIDTNFHFISTATQCVFLFLLFS